MRIMQDLASPSRRRLLGFAVAGLFTPAVRAAESTPLAATWDLYLVVDDSARASANLGAQVLAAAIQNAGGAMLAGNVVETGRLTRDGEYSITSTSTGTGLLASVWRGHLVRESRGVAGGGRLVTNVYRETRGDSAPFSATTDRAAHSIRFDRSGEESTVRSMPSDATDIGALPWLFAGRRPPTAPFTLDYTDGRKLYRASFDVAADRVQLAGATIDAVRLTGRRNAPDDPGVDIWVRKSDGVPLRVRIDLDARYGAVIEQRRSDAVAAVTLR